MFEVGDEVLVKAEIKDDDGNGGKQIKLKGIDGLSPVWFEEYELTPVDKPYEQGIADSWNLLKKVYDMKCETIEQIFDVEGGFWNVIRDFTYEEALAKLEAYEKEKEIKVGDVVECDGHKGVVVKVFESGGVNIVHENGVINVSCPSRKCKKTGKHIDIESLLRQIGE